MIANGLFVDGKPSEEPVDVCNNVLPWLYSMDPTDEDLALLRALRLHPITIEDVKQRHQRPKVEILRDYAFVVLCPIALTGGDMIEKREYPMSLAVMFDAVAGVWWLFRRKGWP